jgi:hypothetical protein
MCPFFSQLGTFLLAFAAGHHLGIWRLGALLLHQLLPVRLSINLVTGRGLEYGAEDFVDSVEVFFPEAVIW